MTAIFEFLFKYRPILYERGTVVLHPLWPWYVTGLILVLIFAGVFWTYRRSAGVVPAAIRLALMGLRALAFLVILAMFLQPSLVLNSVIPQKSFVAVAYDASKSMEIRDGPEGQSRFEMAKYLLRQEDNPLLKALGEKFKLRYFRFAGGADRVGGVEDVVRHGNLTDLERTLEQIAGELGTAPVSGIVLITDGADNHSANLSAVAAKLNARKIPVYPIGIGMSDFSRDTEVLRVTTPKQVLKDTQIEADVSIRSTGYPGRRARLLVKAGDRVIQSQEVTLGSDGEVKTYKVNFSSESAGPRVFTIRLEPFSDEVVQENNDQTVLIRVEDDRPKILYVEGEPRWIYAFLRRAVEEDKNLLLVTLLRQADGKFLRQGVESASTLEQGFPTEKSELFGYKALIIGSLEASFFTFDQLRMISDMVSQRGAGLLMLGGKSAFGQGGYINTPLEDVLPIDIRAGQGPSSMPPYRDVEYKVLLSSYGQQHPVTRLSTSESENQKRWDAAPLLVGINPTGNAKPGATVLAQADLPGTRGQAPAFLAFQRFGKGKSMALLTGSTWRWRMELEHSDNFHELFWKQMLRWLVSDAPDPVAIETEKHSYSLDEPVTIHAEVHDDSFLPLNNAEVTAQIKSPSGQITDVRLSWDVDREGRYSASFKPVEEGIYEISAEASQRSGSLGKSKANFRIAESSDEFHNAALNADLLRNLATETGGRYYTPQEARTLPEDISYVENGPSRIEEKDLWDMPFLFLLLVGAVSAEWVLRKRKGLA